MRRQYVKGSVFHYMSMILLVFLTINAIHFSAVSSNPFAVMVKLDEKAPNEYAWETDEVFMYFSDLDLI